MPRLRKQLRLTLHFPGGMPSPKCSIPIRILPSAAIIPLIPEESQTFIPISILPNRIATVDGFIKAKLRIPRVRTGPEPYIYYCDISLSVTMPYLNRRLDGFGVSKHIPVQHPVSLRDFHVLPNVARGSRIDVSWNIINKGVKEVGFESDSRRQVKLNVSLNPAVSGRLLTRKLGSGDIHGSDTTLVKPNDSLSVKQTVQVSNNSDHYSDENNVVLRVMLSLSTADYTPQSPKFRDVQCCDLNIRTSSVYQHNEQSLSLTVTNGIQPMVYPVQSYLQEAFSQAATSSILTDGKFFVQSLTHINSNGNIKGSHAKGNALNSARIGDLNISTPSLATLENTLESSRPYRRVPKTLSERFSVISEDTELGGSRARSESLFTGQISLEL